LVKLVTFVDYDKTASDEEVIVNVGQQYYIQYNKKKGFNVETQDTGNWITSNKVTIHTVLTQEDTQLLAALDVGEMYHLPNPNVYVKVCQYFTNSNAAEGMLISFSQTTSALCQGVPSVSPPPPPPPAPPSNPAGGRNDPPAAAPSCFSGRTVVEVLGQGPTRMDHLNVGDKLLTSQGHYSPVYTFSHKQVPAKGTYLQILTDDMHQNNPIEITANHFLYVFNEGLKTTELKLAQHVNVGDFLVTATGLPSRIRSIRTLTGKHGLYAPITVSGDLLVNGVLASSYTSVDSLDGFISNQMLHWLSHGTMAPYRLYCAVTGGCEGETYDEATGLNPWINFLSGVQQTLLDSPILIVKASILLASTLPFVLFIILGKVLTTSTLALLTQAAVALFGYWWCRNATGTKNKQSAAKKAS